MLTLHAFYEWLNPEGLTITEKYSAARLLDPANFVEVDEETYWNFLECMPPKDYERFGFSVCEAETQTHKNGAWTDIRLAFYKIDGHYFAAHITDQESHAEGFTATANRIRDRVRAAA